MRRPYLAVLAALLSIGLSDAALAQTDWDDPDRRSGFVIGGGLGPGMTLGDFDETRFGMGSDFRIGARVGESLLLYYVNQANLLDPGDCCAADLVATGVSAFAIGFQPANRVLLTAGAGLGQYTAISGAGDDEVGFGFLGGVGYEFADLWFVDVSVSFASLDFPGDLVNVKAGVSILSH